MTGPSDIARKIADTFLEDAPPPTAPVFKWLQEECRTGLFSQLITEFSQGQQETLQPRLVRVEAVGPDGISCLIPGRHRDHESPATYVVEVRCRVDPSTGSAVRVQ